MKQLVLTGISQETSLINPDEVLIMLVFNNGEVRVPTNEYGVNAILESLGEEEESAPAHPEGAEVFGGNGTTSQDGSEWVAQHDEDGVTDDGDYDINDGVGSV
jgi:hypothetical protein